MTSNFAFDHAFDNTIPYGLGDPGLYEVARSVEEKIALSKHQVEDNQLVALLSSISQGNTAAFGELHRLCRPWMSRVAHRILRNRELAEDVVQESLLKIWQRAALFNRSRGTAKTWIATVVRNHALDVIRRRKLPEAPGDFSDEHQNDCPDTAIDLLSWVDLTATLTIVMRAIDTMPRPMRQSLLMSCYEGYTNIEIAERMQAPVGTVKAWIRRGLQRLRTSTDIQNVSQFAGACVPIHSAITLTGPTALMAVPFTKALQLAPRLTVQ